ncbi:MAG: ISKra4 family transposase [Chloroflexota bacterium]
MTAAYTTAIADAYPFARSTEKAGEMQKHLSSSGTLRAEHGDVERWIKVEGRELLRLMLQEHLELRATAERCLPGVVGVDGVERTQARASERGLESVFGDVEVPRLLYQHGGRVGLAPQDAVLNLPRDHYSHGVREMVAKEVARASYDEVAEIISDYSAAKIAKRQIEELAIAAAKDFDAFYELRKREGKVKVTIDLLVITTDGKGIVMLHEHLREDTRKRAEKRAHKVELRLSPGEKKDSKRMAQVASVYEITPWCRSVADVVHGLRDEATESKRPKPVDKRVWASVERTPRVVIAEAFDEALRRDPERQRRWVVLIDGNATQLDAVKAEAKRVGVKVTILVDVVHVLEYVWKAARAIFGETNEEAETWVSHRFLSLLSGQSGGDVARTIRWWAKQRKLSAPRRRAVAKACGYLADRTRTRLMRYADALRDGLPISTGVIEGACRYLVKDRMDRTGARWTVEGAEAVLKLRAIRASGDFDAYWLFHLTQEKERNHASRYADGRIPQPLPASGRHLRLVK